MSCSSTKRPHWRLVRRLQHLRQPLNLSAPPPTPPTPQPHPTPLCPQTWFHGLGSDEEPNPVFRQAVEAGLIDAEPEGRRRQRQQQRRQQRQQQGLQTCAMPMLPAAPCGSLLPTCPPSACPLTSPWHRRAVVELAVSAARRQPATEQGAAGCCYAHAGGMERSGGCACARCSRHHGRPPARGLGAGTGAAWHGVPAARTLGLPCCIRRASLDTPPRHPHPCLLVPRSCWPLAGWQASRRSWRGGCGAGGSSCSGPWMGATARATRGEVGGTPWPVQLALGGPPGAARAGLSPKPQSSLAGLLVH